MEPPCLAQAVQEKTVFLGTWSAEIVRSAAYRNHQGVVPDAAFGHHFIAFVIVEGRNDDFLG